MCGKLDIYTVRQILVLTAGCMTSFCSGLMLAFPSVLNPAVTAADSTFKVTSDQASWLVACHGISGTFGFCIFSPLFQLVGRKYVNIGLNIVQLVGWIVFIYAENIIDLFAARLIQGLVIGSYFISAVTVGEYCSPKRRGYFMAIKKIALAFGSLACHSLALIIDWRQISMFSCGPLILSAIMILFWPESPAFLAMKGRFSECEKAFLWANGNSTEALQQMKELINAQAERLAKKKDSSAILVMKTTLKKISKRDFLKPLFIATLLTLAVDASGRFFLLTNITQIIQEITGDNSFAMYCAVASDFLILCALSISCVLIKYFKRRTLLFILGIFSNILMFFVSLALILKDHYNIATDVRFLVPSIILLHGFIAHTGLIPTAFTIIAEIFPLEHRGMGCFASGIIFTSLYSVTVKITPPLIESTGVAGTYAIFGVCVLLSLLVLFCIMPETKDKTLQQIEDDIKDVKRTHENDALIDNNRCNEHKIDTTKCA